MRRNPVLIGCLVDIDLGGDVDDDRFLFADAFPPVIDLFGNPDQ